MGKRTGRPQRGRGPSKKARVAGGAGARDGRGRADAQPKGPARVLAKENNARKKRAAERALRFGRYAGASGTDGDTPAAVMDASDDEALRGSESGGSSVDEDQSQDEDEEGPQASYNRLMQTLQKNAVGSDDDESATGGGTGDSDGDDEDSESQEEDEEDGEEIEWEEVSSDDEEDHAAEGGEDDEESDGDDDDSDDDDDAREELSGSGSQRRRRSAEDRQNDPEADRDELGLDAEAPEEEEEEEEQAVEEGAAHSTPGAVKMDTGGFARFFDCPISSEQAQEADKLREGSKWKKVEWGGEGGVNFLWRKGSVGAKALPAPAADTTALADLCGADSKMAQLFMQVAEAASSKRSQGAAAEDGHDGAVGRRSKVSGLSHLQRALLPLLDSYMDVYYCARRPGAVADEVREALALHVLNHVTKSREAVLKHNLQLRKKPELECRDQGYTRCKVLVLLPSRNSAYRFVRTLLALSPNAQAPQGRVDNLGRFREEFGPGDQEDRQRDRERLLKVGQDHWERFEGNVEDHFRIGIQMHSKYARLFAPFYSADILVASPLGLRMIVKSETDKARETDFLSSIEVLLVHLHLPLSLYLHPYLHL